MIVVDASIVVKIVLVEQDSDRAVVFLRAVQGETCGPDVLPLEVCSAWVAAANARRIEKPRARAAIVSWLDEVERGAINVFPTDLTLMTQAAELALHLGHPLKDCIYLALADRLGFPLATCDVKFRDRVADPARVRLLDELV